MEYYYFWLVLFSFIVYIFITDKNVEQYFLLLLSLVKFQYEKQKWWLMNNPRNLLVKWMIYRRSMKMAEEFMKEFEKEMGIEKRSKGGL